MKFKKIISFLIIITVLFTFGVSSFCFAEGEQSGATNFKDVTFTGTFIQPWVYGKWSEKRADKEFKKMKEYGVDTLIMGDCANKGDNGKWGVEYPSKLPEFEGATCGKDNVKLLLDLCKKYDIKLYLGLGVDNVWWSSDLSQEAAGKWFEEAMTISAKMARELYDLYKADYGDTFYGYYSVYELWNHHSWNTDNSRASYVKNLSNGFNIVIDAINKIDPDMPLVFSPFSTNPKSANDALATKDNTQKFYTEFFKATNFRKIDAFSPMDNCGGGGQTVETLEEWTKAYAKAVEDGGNKLQFWSNCESFIQPKDKSGPWTTAPVNRYIEQVRITQKYASKILNFSYPHYMSPYNTTEGFDKSYLNYLKTGEMDKTPPTAPGKVETSLLEKKMFVAKWEESADEYGIAQYHILKYDPFEKEFKEFGKNVVGQDNGSGIDPKVKKSFTDSGYNRKGKNIYSVRAMDCSGNLSEPTYIVFDSEKLSSSVDFSSTNEDLNKIDLNKIEGVVAFYTQAEFDKLDLETKSSDDEKTPPDSKIMLLIIAGAVIFLAVLAVLIVFIMSKKNRKEIQAQKTEETEPSHENSENDQKEISNDENKDSE